MKKIICFILACVLVLPFAGIDARAAAMGGAYTAIAKGYSAAYWNPAGITDNLFLSFGASGSVCGKLSDISKVSDFINNPDYTNIPDLDVGSDLMLGIQFLNYGLSNVTRLELNAARDDYGKASGYNELIFTYGLKLADLPLNLAELNLGANLKYINSELATATFDTQTQTTESGSGIGVDLGVLVGVSEIVKVGLTIKDIGARVKYTGEKTVFPNSPESTPSRTEKIPVSIQLGASASLPLVGTVLAADIHTRDGDTTVHCGVEQGLGLMAFRLGARTDADSGDILWSAGVGLRAAMVFFDLAYVQTATDSEIMLAGSFKF